MQRNIQIINYATRYRSDFKSINQQWIEQYFKMEESDYKSLDHPEDYVLANGGAILMAVDGEKAVGTVALIKMDGKPYDFELAKMGVLPEYHGLGIGFRLGEAIIEKAKTIGARNLYLESNTVLAPAIHLYRKLGFVEVKDVYSPYTRCDIQMELWF